MLSGRGRFVIADGEPREAGPGAYLFWEKGIMHGMIEVLEAPLVALAHDVPRRDPNDVVWKNPAEAAAFTK